MAFPLVIFFPKVALHLDFLPFGFSENITTCSFIFQEQKFQFPGYDIISYFKGCIFLSNFSYHFKT